MEYFKQSALCEKKLFICVFLLQTLSEIARTSAPQILYTICVYDTEADW